MKIAIYLLTGLVVAVTAPAQTNATVKINKPVVHRVAAPVPQYMIALRELEIERGQVERQLADLDTSHRDAEDRYRKESAAGHKVNEVDRGAKGIAYKNDRLKLVQKINAFKLKESDIRKQFNIPEEKPKANK